LGLFHTACGCGWLTFRNSQSVPSSGKTKKIVTINDRILGIGTVVIREVGIRCTMRPRRIQFVEEGLKERDGKRLTRARPKRRLI
jgi:hypothetical protein